LPAASMSVKIRLYTFDKNVYDSHTLETALDQYKALMSMSAGHP